MCTVRSHLIDSLHCLHYRLLCYCIRKLQLNTLDVPSYTHYLTRRLKQNQYCVSADFENSERSEILRLAKRQKAFIYLRTEKNRELN